MTFLRTVCCLLMGNLKMLESINLINKHEAKESHLSENRLFVYQLHSNTVWLCKEKIGTKRANLIVPGKSGFDFENTISSLFYWFVSSDLMPPSRRWISLDIADQRWFGRWLGVRQKAITWASVHPDLCSHMASPGNNELMLSWNSILMWYQIYKWT